MKVAELLEALETVAPALADSDTVPIERHFWFTGGKVIAYNEWLGMMVPCKVGAEMTAPLILRDVLKASYQAGTVEFEVDLPKGKQSGHLLVYVGKNPAKFPTMNVEDTKSIFRMPKIEGTSGTVFADKLGKAQLAIDVCLLSVGTDGNFPERVGITIAKEDEGLALYGFNNDSIARCLLEGKAVINQRAERITVPTQFWTVFQNLTKGKDVQEAKASVEVMLDAKHVVARVGEVMLFAKVLPVDNPSPLRKVYEEHFNTAVRKNLVPINQKLERAVGRSIAVSKNDVEPSTTITVKGGHMILTTAGGLGDTDDEFEFDHPDTAPLVIPAKKLASLELFERIAVGKRSVVLVKAERVYMVSGLTGAK